MALAELDSDESLVVELFDHAIRAIGPGFDPRNAEPELSRLAKGLAINYRVWTLEFEIGNGGFPQLFDNHGVAMPKVAVSDLRFIGEVTRAYLLEKAIELELGECPHVDDKKWRHLDCAHTGISTIYPIEEILQEFFRSNIGLFTQL
jgi:hypothetical protein